jgi:hypothetical protein
MITRIIALHPGAPDPGRGWPASSSRSPPKRPNPTMTGIAAQLSPAADTHPLFTSIPCEAPGIARPF